MEMLFLYSYISVVVSVVSSIHVKNDKHCEPLSSQDRQEKFQSIFRIDIGFSHETKNLNTQI